MKFGRKIIIISSVFSCFFLFSSCKQELSPSHKQELSSSRKQELSSCNPEKKYLVVKTYAGMANRLRVLASSRVMADLTGRHLVVYWEKIDKEMPASWDDLFLNPMTMIENSSLPAQGCDIERIQSALSDDQIVENMGIKNDLNDQEKLAKIPQFDKPIVYFETSLNFAPDKKYLSTDEYNLRYAQFYKNLVPTKWAQDEIKAFKKKHDFENRYVVGVHYRSWGAGPADEHDNLWRDLNFQYVPDYLKEMKAVSSRLPDQIDNKKEVAFFLATDSPDAKKAFMSDPDLKNRIITRDAPIGRDTVRGQESAVVDFFLLGDGEFIIGTYQSSFSDETQFLTKQKYKKNIGKAAYKNSKQ
ncbi:MAG: hypothetical protein AAF310_05860 [Myxococcota bacterium]